MYKAKHCYKTVRFILYYNKYFFRYYRLSHTAGKNTICVQISIVKISSATKVRSSSCFMYWSRPCRAVDRQYTDLSVQRTVCDVRQTTTDRAVDRRYTDLCVYRKQCVTSDKEQQLAGGSRRSTEHTKRVYTIYNGQRLVVNCICLQLCLK